MRNAYSVEELYEIIRLKTIEGLSSRKIAARVGGSKSTVNRFLAKETYPEFWENYKKPHASATLTKPESRRKRLSGKRFFFTCAQNNTYIPQNFWDSLQNFLKHRDCELVVGTSYYNKSAYHSIHQEANTKETHGDGGGGATTWFDPKVQPYIRQEPLVVAENLLWCGELNISPTKVNVLSGIHNLTKKESGIIPHCKVQLESLPVHQEDESKMLYTTGSITYPNFIQRLTGQKAEFHHVFGGLYVEIDEDGDWFARHIQAESDTGRFYDLTEYFTPEGVQSFVDGAVEAIHWGDLHVEVIDEPAANACFGLQREKRPDGKHDFWTEKDNGNMLDTLRPKFQFCHDTSDFTPRNHHNIKDPHFRFKMFNDNYDTVEGALKECADCLGAMSRDFVETVVVESNHDLALVRWLKETDFRVDPPNAVFYLETQLDYYKAIERKDDSFNIFAHTMRKLNVELYNHNVTFLNTDEPFYLFGKNSGIYCGWHGDKGANGSRGSLRGFTKVGMRVNIGHSHTAGIFEGVYQAGVMSKIPLPYAQGATSWSHSQIITYANGKRAIVTVKNGKWRA